MKPSVKVNDLSHAGMPISLAALWRRTKATRDTATTDGWTPPDWDELHTFLNRDALQLRHNGIVREVQVITADNQFKLQLTLATIAEKLTSAREAWLMAFLREANANWPLVAFKLTKSKNAAIAEVDLTGSDHQDFIPLLRAALDSFRWLVAGVVETTEIITAPSECESGILDSFLPTGHVVQSVTQ